VVLPVDPLLHKYDVAPDEVSITVAPGQILPVAFEEIEMTGAGITVTVDTADPVQPPLTPVNVYDVVVEGVTVTLAAPEPLLHV
jgi:hypothetical protein